MPSLLPYVTASRETPIVDAVVPFSSMAGQAARIFERLIHSFGAEQHTALHGSCSKQQRPTNGAASRQTTQNEGTSLTTGTELSISHFTVNRTGVKVNLDEHEKRAQRHAYYELKFTDNLSEGLRRS